jgi:peroxiredoxin
VVRDISNIIVKWVQAGIAAPEFEAQTLEGQPFKLSELRGKVVLLDFWATWCGPCVAELPAVKKIYEKYKDDGFTVVGISFDRDAAAAKKFVSERQLSWPQVWAEKGDKGPLANVYGVGGIPATFLIGADGKVVDRDLRGEDLSKAVGRAVKKAGKAGSEKAASLSVGGE